MGVIQDALRHVPDKVLRDPHVGTKVCSWLTAGERRRAEEQPYVPSPHVRPDSVFVVSIGNRWKPGCEEAVHRMIEHSMSLEICTWFREIGNVCVMPYDRVGAMRCEATHMAMDSGFEWMLMVENDAMPPVDLIPRLLKHGLPVIAPLLVDKEQDSIVCYPRYSPNMGLRRAKFTAMSLIMMNTRVFNAVGADVWGSGAGDPEGLIFQRLYHMGHSLFIDTGVQVPVTKTPSRPDGKPWDEYWAWMKDIHERRWEPIDRCILGAPEKNGVGVA